MRKEGNTFINELAMQLGHPDDKGQTAILLRATLYTLRDRIAISESFHLIAQLPIFLKALYVQQWTYRENPEKFESLEKFKQAVKNEQAKFGETRFDWQESTGNIVRTIFTCLGKHWTPEEIEHVVTQLPQELKTLFAGNRQEQAAKFRKLFLL